MPIRDELELFNAPRIRALQERAKMVQEESEKVHIARLLFREIQRNSESIVGQLEEGVSISNFDEVKASLHNEFSKNTKLVLKALQGIDLSTKEQSSIIRALHEESKREMDNDFQTVILKKPRDKVTVDNFDEILFPSSTEVSNLIDIQGYLNELGDRLSKSFNITVEAPKVIVEPTPITIPETSINIPDFDLKPIVSELKKSLEKIRFNSKNKPLAVRLSDGQDFIDKLENLVEGQREVFASFPGSLAIKDKRGRSINPATEESVGVPSNFGSGNKAVTTAGTAVQLASSTVSKKVFITAKTANTSTIWVGGSNVANGTGIPLLALQSEIFEIDNLSKIYIDSQVNGEGVTYTYVS